MRQITLSHWIVCGQLELEEFIRYKVIRPWEPRRAQDRFIYLVKYPNHKFYNGGWGNERLIVSNDYDPKWGRCGVVWSTESRSQEIVGWINKNLFECIPGED
jgi:hypothetical protein